MRVGLFLLVAALCPGSISAQDRLVLDAPGGAPAVVAAVDPAAHIPATFRARDPYQYDCVATLALRDSTGALVVDRLDSGDGVPLRERVWVFPERLYDKRQHPRVAGLEGQGDDRRLIVAWRPDNSRLRYVVTIDPMASDSAPVETEAFDIPVDAMVLCGKIPGLTIGIMMPDGTTDGLNLGLDFSLRAPWTRSCVQTIDSAAAATTPIQTREHCFLRGLLELRGEGAMTTAGSSELLNHVSIGARLAFKPLGGWNQWITLGPVARLEGTERLDILNGAWGASLEARLDMVRPENVKTFWRRFTPYPTLTVEYTRVFTVLGATAFQDAGWEGPAQRMRIGIGWTVPMLVQTTFGVKFRTDYFLSGQPADREAVNVLLDLTLRYGVSPSGEVGLIGRVLAGSAPPLYRGTTRYLAGLDLSIW